MELWIPITICAAFCQNARSAVQKSLQCHVGTTGATFARFGYGLPFAAIYVIVLHVGFSLPLPSLNAVFLVAGAAGGLAQIAGTFLLVYLFSQRNFAVGTAYSKTEPIQAALFGFVLLGEKISWASAGFILVGIGGVVVISLARSSLSLATIFSAVLGRSALIGMASAALFGASAIAYRVASLALEGTGVAMQAGFALFYATVFQTVLMVVWMLLKSPATLQASVKAWRSATWAGALGIAGSIGWFTAMTLQNVAYVRALAQIEMVFTLLASFFVFKEAVSDREILGCILIIAAVVGIVLTH
ncbi:putative membrane protein [Roseibium hamelinense]|uniref:Putative membrane protein n=1 Tax=Roseibium hamelinense TaxID=150831 RepID=A0A562SHP6_9HYPH|nr:DMT family transporter [Roseibium hamelinense]MTI43894.1 DMT family transporter [Roseibium hamelinense]TWI80811.1 putative membrane protein [Roseibium hamelinense]